MYLLAGGRELAAPSWPPSLCPLRNLSVLAGLEELNTLNFDSIGNCSYVLNLVFINRFMFLMNMNFMFMKHEICRHVSCWSLVPELNSADGASKLQHQPFGTLCRLTLDTDQSQTV